MGRRADRRAIYAAAAFALAALALELTGQALFYLKFRALPAQFARLHYGSSEHHYMTDHPYLPYLAMSGNYGGMRFNSLGDRGPEPDNPKRRTRVVCYGGSTTFDGSHPEEKTWPGVLQRLLGADRYEVINAAQNGATTADSLVNFALLHSDLKPDYVLALEGINDLESSYMPGFRADYAHRRRKIGSEPYPFFRSLPRWLNLSSFYVALRWKLVGPRGDLHAQFSRPGKYDFESGPFGLSVFRRNLLQLAALAEEHGGQLVLGTPPYYRPWADANFGPEFGEGWRRGIDAENEIVRELARIRPGIHLAEVARSFSPGTDTMVDFCHLTEKGNELVARAFYRAIRRAEARRAI